MKKRLMSVCLIMAMLITACFGMTSVAFADQGNCVNVQLTVDGKEPVTIKAYYASYTYNTYVSLEDLAWALKGTDKAFDIADVDGLWTVTTGTDYTGEAPVVFSPTALEDPTDWDKISFDAYDIAIDDQVYELRMYDNYAYSSFTGEVEGIYMRLIDLGMFMNMAFGHEGYGLMSIDTEADFVLDKAELEENEYFCDLDGVYLGDVTTGEELLAWDENHSTEIASTSKLMTMAVVFDAIADGTLEEGLDTIYTISDAVYYEAQSEDGTLYSDIKSSGKVKMQVGQTWTVDDLLHALMLPSANEAGTALAEAVAGSEAEFVKMMNAKADELGMETAKFYNPHGLPHYTNSQFTGKMQNEMSAADMFTLCSYLLTEYYDETVAITGDEIHYLESLADDGYTEEGEKGYVPYVKTTYGTLHQNIGDSLIGLKTGSTNRSGSCIVVAEVVQDADGKDHVIVGVSFGGEDNRQRYESSTVLLKYGKQVINKQYKLDAPVVEATNIANTGKVKLTWNAVEGAAKYEVYSAVEGGEFSLLTTIKGTALTNTSAVAEQTYSYKVKAIAAEDSAKDSDFSNVVEKTCDLAKPTLKATNVAKTGKVKLTWNAVEGADKYQVYRATSKDGVYYFLGATKGTTLINTSADAEKTYYYMVKAVSTDNKDAHSAYSAKVARTCDLAAPVASVSVNKNGCPVVKWNKVEGAEKYVVYRATSANGEFAKLITTKGTVVTNTTVKAGTTYFYKVVAISENAAANSAAGAVVSCTAK